MCSIDASKAFVSVNILLLFRKLRKRNFCPLFLRYLVNSYCNQIIMVRWNGSLSDKVDVTKSVKQGGVRIVTFVVFCLHERSIMPAKRSEYWLPYE